MASNSQVKVWDLPIRLFHWTLVAGFVTAYVSGEFRHGDVHVLVGYALCVLLAVRLVLGFAGGHYARFSSFIFSPAETIEYLRSMRAGNPKHYFGHNPAGALMVFALLALLAIIFMTGLMTLGVIDFEGPLAFMANDVSDDTAYAIYELHEFLTNFAVALVALHVMGVVVGSVQHKENLVRAMVTGRKTAPSHSV